MNPIIPVGWRLVLPDETILPTDMCSWVGIYGEWDNVDASIGSTPNTYRGGEQFKKGLSWIANRPPPMTEEKEWVNLYE